jgi:hypothetical protein
MEVGLEGSEGAFVITSLNMARENPPCGADEFRVWWRKWL